MDENPYKSPAGLQGRPIVARAILVVAVCSIAGAAIGTGVGYSLGRFAPAYYRSVFREGNAPGFDPVEVGIGLGLTQGIALGFIAGIVIVLALMRRSRRRVT
jgi:hypothetical protein